MNKVNIKKFENFEDSIIRRNQSSENTYRFGQSEKSQIIKSISEHQEIQSKLSRLDLEKKINLLGMLSDFQKEIFENTENDKIEKLGKILNYGGLSIMTILSIVGAITTGIGLTTITPFFIGAIVAGIVSGIGKSIQIDISEKNK
jgi:hypothetical protein